MIRGGLTLLENGGGKGIRTPETFQPNSFQDCRDRPLRHPSDLVRQDFTATWLGRIGIWASRPIHLFGEQFRRSKPRPWRQNRELDTKLRALVAEDWRFSAHPLQ